MHRARDPLREADEAILKLAPGDEASMVLATSYKTVDGAYRWGPRVHIEPFFWDERGATCWKIDLMGKHPKILRCDVLQDVTLNREPLLCFAARAAVQLWADVDVEWEQPALVGVDIQLYYGQHLVVQVTADADKQSWICEGWEFRERCHVELDLATPARSLSVGRLVMWLLVALAFAGGVPALPKFYEPTSPLPLPWQRMVAPPTREQMEMQSMLFFAGGMTRSEESE